MPPVEARLRPGDLLLYTPAGVFGWLIAIKTGSRYCHVEVYDGDGCSLAAREGTGVRRYPFRRTQLGQVRRLNVPFDAAAARAWFDTVDGAGYDWKGLLNFFWARRQGRRTLEQFCSEFALRVLRAGIWGAMQQRMPWLRGKPYDLSELVRLRLDPMHGYDADGVAPGHFPLSPRLDLVDLPL